MRNLKRELIALDKTVRGRKNALGKEKSCSQPLFDQSAFPLDTWEQDPTAQLTTPHLGVHS